MSCRQWFAVQIRYRFEKKVAEQLQKVRSLPPFADRTSHVERPAEDGNDSSVSRVRICADRAVCRCAAAVLETAGLIGFVSFGGIVAAMPRKQIEDLQLLLQEKGLLPCTRSCKAGQRVRVRGGCLDGLEGVLVEHEKGKLVISIESIQRSLAIEISGYEMEVV